MSIVYAKHSKGFSIHKRIEGGATNRRTVVSRAVWKFQYPQADRRGCNEVPMNEITIIGRLFQYPQADRRGCNQPGSTVWRSISSVSVSTSGSKGVQRIEHEEREINGVVSVSTSGSKGVQLLYIIFYFYLSVMFQYPQADRRGCNTLIPESYTILKKVSVSTSGSKGVQPRVAVVGRVIPSEFQYPQADRRGCNGRRLSRLFRDDQVSVSTSGSKGVQRCADGVIDNQ